MAVFLPFMLILAIGAVIYITDRFTKRETTNLIRAFLSDRRTILTENLVSQPHQPVSLCKKLLIEDYLYDIADWRKLKAYKDHLKHSFFRFIRKVRPDGYCKIRCVLVQMLIGGIHIKKRWQSKNKALQRLKEMQENKIVELNGWTFGGLLRVKSKNTLWAMEQLIHILWATFDEACKLTSSQSRETWLEVFLNTHPKVDLLLMEAVKVLTVVDHFDVYMANDNAIFADEVRIYSGSNNFIISYVDKIGKKGGKTGVEVPFLAHGLGVKIYVCCLTADCSFKVLHAYNNQADLPGVTVMSENMTDYNIFFQDRNSAIFIPLLRNKF